jgi:hypothetical protein
LVAVLLACAVFSTVSRTHAHFRQSVQPSVHVHLEQSQRHCY